MNRELEKLLKEKWFLVAADLIAVFAILVAMPDKRDGLETFLVICAILLASLIVVIPVLQEGGGKAERQAEQARLRAKLAEEIDLQRDNVRAGNEALNRRIAEVEMSTQKAAEVAAAAVAQRASAEINALKASLAVLEKKVQEAGATDALEELSSKVDALAETVRAVVADVDEAAEALGKAKAEVTQSLEAEIKSVREEIKKSAKSAEKSVDKVEAALETIREEVREIRANPSVASAPERPSVTAPVPEAEAMSDTADEEGVDEEVIEEIEESPSPVAEASEPAAAGTGTALIVNLMIGIGNKPFVRGTGPGLSQDKGVPMSFLGIGRWQWISPDPEAPATIEVWKNDQSPMGEPLHISGGEPLEVDEGHFGGG